MGIELHCRLTRRQAQQEPTLLLANADRLLPAPDVALWQAVAKPLPGFSKHLHMVWLQTHLLVQLPIHGLFGGLAAMNATLRELPGIKTTDTTTPQHPALFAGDDNTHVGTESLLVYDTLFARTGQSIAPVTDGCGACVRCGNDTPVHLHLWDPVDADILSQSPWPSLRHTRIIRNGAQLTLAIFDLDNTLIAGDSDHRWGEFACAEGLVDATRHARANDAFLQDYQDGCLDIDAYLRFALSTIAGLTLAEVAALQKRFVRDWVEPMILPAAEALLEQHRKNGDTLLIITATNSVVTRPIADRLGVKHLIGCEAERQNGTYTGQPTGIPSFREGKIQRLQAWLGEHPAATAGAYFYSDSHNDLPLLEWVDNPVAVDPDPRLKNIAGDRNWPVISLR